MLILLPLISKAALIPVRNKKPLYTIVLPASPTTEEFHSADYLQRYVYKISQATIPIVSDNSYPGQKEIIIGQSERLKDIGYFNAKDTLSEDAFVIKTVDEKIYIIGGKHKGLFYAVVTLLENYLGCRKYSPDYEYIPQKHTLELPEINLYEKPLNNYRVVYGNFCANKEYKDWHRLNEIDDVFGEGYYVHTFWKLMRPDKYFKDHPEYFSLIDGERSTRQPCLSNPEVLRIIVENLRKEMSNQPTRNVWSVSQNDNHYYCQCPECKKIIEEEGSPSGPIIRFVNKIAEEFPDKTISTLAYTYSRHPPKLTKPVKNVQIMLCSIELNRNIPIEIDTSSRNFIKDIHDWEKISNNLYLWDYNVNFCHNISPFPNFHTLQSNIQFFVKNGIKDQFQQINNESGYEFSELKTYLISKLLWNPYIRVDTVIFDFIKGYYGKSATYVINYLYQLERQTARSQDWLNIYGSPTWHSKTFLSEENIKYYKACMDTAIQMAKDDSVTLRHVEIAFLPLEYAVLEIAKQDIFGPRGWFIQQNGSYLLQPAMKAELDRFYYVCKKYNIKTINEAGLTPKDYYLSTLRFILPQNKDNLAYGKKVTASPLPNKDYNRGDLSILTNGFYGTNDYTFQWLGWQGTDFELTLDLEKLIQPQEISISSLNYPVNRAFYPNRITCFVSDDGNKYNSIGQIEIGNQDRLFEVTRTFTFSTILTRVRYVKFKLDCTKILPTWMTSDGDKSWTFIDEIIVKGK